MYIDLPIMLLNEYIRLMHQVHEKPTKIVAKGMVDGDVNCHVRSYSLRKWVDRGEIVTVTTRIPCTSGDASYGDMDVANWAIEISPLNILSDEDYDQRMVITNFDSWSEVKRKIRYVMDNASLIAPMKVRETMEFYMKKYGKILH